MANLLSSVKVSSKISSRVIVFYSGGKDSAVTLDLCCKYFEHVDVVFMYYVPGLSFQDRIIRWAEAKYGVKVIRLPHFELSQFLRYGSFRPMDLDVPVVSIRDVYTYARSITQTWWIAAGERISDSIIRRAMIKQSGSIDVGRGRFYPIAEWRKSDIMGYIKQNRLMVSPESATLGFSFRSLQPKDLILIKQHYPDDFVRITNYFPLAEASIRHYEYFGRKEQSIE